MPDLMVHVQHVRVLNPAYINAVVDGARTVPRRRSLGVGVGGAQEWCGMVPLRR